MPSIIDLISQRFNGMFDPAPSSGYQQAPELQTLIDALQKKAMPDRAPGLMAMPTTTPRSGPTLADNWGQPPPPQQPMTGVGGPPGVPQPPPMPMGQPHQPQMPQPAPQGGIQGFLNGPKGDALMGLLQGWAQGGTWQESLGAGGAGAVAGMKQGKKNRTLQLYLNSRADLDPATRELLSGDPDLAKQFISAQFAGKDNPAAVMEYKFAEKQGFKGTYLEFIKAKEQAGAGGSYGKQPIYGRDEATGETVLGVIGPDGKFARSEMPQGVLPLGPEGTAAARAFGTKTGEAKANIGVVENAGSRLITAIDDALSDPALAKVTGPVQSWLPNVTGEANRAQSRLDQIQGATFLQAYNDLRGGGQITEAEGSKATAAYNRLASTGMSDEDFKKALTDFRAEIVKLVEIAKQRAGGEAPSVSPGWSDLGGGVRIRALP